MMELKSNTEAFYLDFLGNNEAFEELFSLISEHNQINLKQIQELLTLRNINADTSDEVVRNTLRHLGITVPREVLDKTIDSMRHTINSVSRYAQVSGTSEWHQFLAFLLQSHVRSDRLYTKDYAQFYTQPQGRTIIDGGDWYKTTHVALEVGHDLMDVIDLTLEQDDQDTVVSTIVKLGKSESFALAWHVANVGSSLAAMDDITLAVRTAIFRSKMEQLYYTWSPIEDVIDQFYITVPIQSSLHFSAHVALEPKRYITLGKPLQESVTFSKYSTVQGGDWMTFGAVINYSDGTTSTVDCAVADHEYITEREGKSVFIKEPLAIERTKFVLSVGDVTTEIEVQLLPIGVNIEPYAIELDVPTLYGSSTNQIRVWGLYEDGSKSVLSDSGSIRLSSSLGTLDGNNLIIPHLVGDTEVTLSASFTGLKIIDDVTTVLPVSKSTNKKLPVGLELSVPKIITQGQDTEVTCTVTYNDYTQEEVTPLYSTTAPEVSIVDGVLKCGEYRSDIDTVIVARYSEDGIPVSCTASTMLRAPVPKLANVTINLPEDIEERQVVRPTATALWVKETATQEQIDSKDHSIILAEEEVEGVWSTFAVSEMDIKSLSSLNTTTGEFITPSVGTEGEVYSLTFRVPVGDTSVGTTAIFQVNDRKYVPETIDTSGIIKIQSGSTVLLPCNVRWNTGKSTLANATMEVSYLPSQSALSQAAEWIQEEIDRLTALGEDHSHLDINNPDWSQYMTLELSDSDNVFRDPMLNMDAMHKQLYYTGRTHGAVEIKIAYEFEGNEVTTTRKIQLVPERSVVESVELIMPKQVTDRSRTFIQLEATYSNGQKDFVSASNWSAYYNGDDEDYTLVEFVPGLYTGREIVVMVNGEVPDTIAEFQELQCSSWPVFSSVGSLEDLDNIQAEGAIMGVRKTNEVLPAEIWARYYRTETKQNIVIVPTPLSPINEIVYSRIEGATEFSAEVPSEGYALVNTYLMPGLYNNVFGEVTQGEPYQHEIEVSSDWAIVSSRLFEVVDGERVFTDTDEEVARIDGDGYLTPSQNVNAEIVIRATFFDGFTRIVRDLTVYMHQANVYLTSMVIRGQGEIWDISSRNPTVEYATGSWYIPYDLMVTLQDGQQIFPDIAEWSIGDRTNVESVSVDSRFGKFYLGEKQLSDGLIVLDAVYSERSPISEQIEYIHATLDVPLMCTDSIVSAYLELPPDNINPNEPYQLTMNYERRDGRTASSDLVDADSVKFEWKVIEGVRGFVLNSDGTFQFASKGTPQEVTVSCTIAEQRTKIEEQIVVVCPGVGFPTALNIVAYNSVRDDSIIQVKAMLSRGGTFHKDDVSSNVTWNVCNSRGDVVTVPGITIDTNGRLTIDKLLADTDFSIHCVYKESEYKLEALHLMTAYSSYPRYGVAAWGISTIEEVESNLTDRLRSDQGGTFVLSPSTSEYGYFVVRSDYGRPEFMAAADNQGNVNSSWVGWEGANWPVTGDDGSSGPKTVTKEYENVTDVLHIYRTDARAFGISVLTTRYIR